MRLIRPFRNLRLVWKLLLPLLTGALVLGLLGSFLVVSTLTTRAQTTLDGDLFRRSVVADARLRDQAAYLIEAVRFGANTEGVAEALRDRDVSRLQRLVAAVPATRPQIDLYVVTDRSGRAVFELRRTGGRLVVSHGGDWSRSALIAQARQAGPQDLVDKRVGLQPLGADTELAVAAPVRLPGLVGVVLAGVRVAAVAASAAGDVGGPVAFFVGRTQVGARGAALPAPPAGADPRASVRRLATVDGRKSAVGYSPVVLDDQVLATLAVSLPTGPAFASVGSARSRLLILLAVTLLGLIAFGALVNHLILSQVRPLVTLNRAVGRGDLSGRTPVLGNDELGELARGFNLMAEQLEAVNAEAEHLVAARTQELERLYRELAELSRERSQTFAALSHEFRNDLLVISGYAELMVAPTFDASEPGWREEFGGTIQRSVRTALERVSEALEVARSERPSMELALQPGIDLEALLEELRTTVLALAGRADLHVEWDVQPALPAVTADPRRLREVVVNLVSNAVKYTRTGGSLRIAVGADGNYVALSVADTGVGIPQDALPHVFEPFYKVAETQPQRGEPSSGVGLAHVKRVVEAHGGTVTVVSEMGRGSTFTVLLPRARGRSRRRSLQTVGRPEPR